MEIEYIYYYPFIPDIDTVDVDNYFDDSNFYTIIMIYRELVKKYKDYKISIKNIADEKNKDYKYEANLNCGVFIRNKENKKYLYLSLCDSISQFYGLVSPNEIKNCVEIFSKVGVHDNHINYLPYKISENEYAKYTQIGRAHV